MVAVHVVMQEIQRENLGDKLYSEQDLVGM